MEQRRLGALWPVSALTFGGGGIGQVWGETTREEAVATVRAAVEAGINLIDVAPSYGDGESERVIGEAFDGRLPDGVRIATKCLLGNPPAAEMEAKVRKGLEQSLALLRLDRVDLFFMHSYIVPDGTTLPREAGPAYPDIATRRSLYTDAWCPLMDKLVAEGLIGAWAISGIGVPNEILAALAHDPAPAAVQAIANLLDSPGALRLYDEPPRPREIIAEASGRGIGVLGIRAVQAGALTDGFDRDVPEDHPESADFRRAEPFRALARELGENPAILAHRYALSMTGVDTVILGVKNRAELEDCVAAAEAGPLDSAIIKQIDTAVGGARD